MHNGSTSNKHGVSVKLSHDFLTIFFINSEVLFPSTEKQAPY
jgi:hypothetical protein